MNPIPKFALAALLFCSLVKVASSETVTLAWDPNPETDVSGYKVHYGTASGTYTQTVDAGNATTATVANLTTGTTYYFAATAYNTGGLESLPSTEISVLPVSVPVNTAPTLSSLASQTISEDSSTGALAFTVADTATAAGSLTVTGSSSNVLLVPNANIVFGGSGASRTVTVTPAANQNGTATITRSVSDGVLTATSTFLLTVSAVNDAPTLSTLASLTITGGSSTGALAFSVGDIETAAGSLTVTGSSSNALLVPSASIVFGGSGASRTVTVTPAANQNGTATITRSVSDGVLTATSTFLLTVSPAVNAPPTLSALASQTIGEDSSTGALAFSVGDTATAAGSLTVTGSSSNAVLVPNANIVFGGSGANRTVTVTPAANQNGTATITRSVSDGVLTATSTFLLTVSAVNDAPTLSTLASLTITGGSSTGALAFTVGDIETAAGSLTVAGSSSNALLVPNANIVFGGSGASRTVTVTPAAGQSGTAAITRSVSDGVLTAASTFLLTVSAVAPPGLWEMVAVSGDMAPGSGSSLFAAFASRVRSDGAGNAAFRADLNSALGSAGGVWVETNGLLELAARQGSAAPGVSGGLFDVFATSPWWSGTGHLLLSSKLQIGSGGVTLADDGGLWYKSPSGSLQLVARENGPAAGLAAGAKYLQLGSNAALRDDGRYAFTAALQSNTSLGITSANNSGLWTNFSGSPTMMVREGAAAPGTTNGASFDTFTSALVSANSSGQIAFRASLKLTTSVTSANRYGIWMWDGTQMALIARGGNQAPGTTAGAVFSVPKAPLLRDAMMVFYATLSTATGGVTSANDAGIWILENGAVRLLAREGSAAPGAPSGAVFNSLPEPLAGNDQGDLIFKAALRTATGVDSSNNGGVWARSPATANVLTLIAREGFPAPQTPVNAVFTTFGTAVVSGGGREAFTANLLQGQGGVTTANDRGLWMRATTGGIALILREGDTVAISSTDLRKVADITLDDSSQTGAAGFSSGDSIKIVVAFTDGSSAILSGNAP